MTASQELLDTDTLTGVVAHDTSHDPFPVTGWDFRSGGGDRRADSSRGHDDDALATDLHGNHCSRDAPNCSTAYLPAAPARRAAVL